MPRRRSPVPSYRLHKPTGQAVVTIRTPGGDRKDVYLGKHGSPESLAEYRRVIALAAAGQSADPPSPDPTVAELLLAYLAHAREVYRTPDGKPAPSFAALGRAVRPLRALYAHTQVDGFGPKDLKAVRAAMVAAGNTRKVVNARVQVIRRVFRWGVAEGLVGPEVVQRLAAVDGLRAGRTDAPDRPPVRPADPAHVDACLPLLPPPVAALVRLQRMTGARCGELVVMRAADLDRSDPEAWAYTPPTHKGSWRGKGRVVLLGRRCQAVLAPFLLAAGGPDVYLFCPKRAEAARNADRGERRVTPRWPSHMARNTAKRKKGRRRPPRDRYDTQSVRQAVTRACRKAGVPGFTPHQLRHLAATEIRAELGPEVARAVLGHSLAAMTEQYSRAVDIDLARKAAVKFG